MKGFFTFISCFMICLGVQAQAKTSNKDSKTASPNAPLITESAIPEEGISFREVTYDFGKIPQGKPVTHTFIFTNKGKTPLVLNNVNASCGCTTPVWDREPIKPGESGKIVVGYNAAAEGPFDKPVSIVYNGNLTKEIHVKGEVWKTPVSPAPENNLIKSLNKQK
jgi:hypothetical protein